MSYLSHRYFGRRTARWVCGAGVITGVISLSGAAAAPAQNLGSLAKAEAYSAPTKVAKGLSPLDVLLIEDKIRQKWADYTLMYDGDGLPNQSRAWAGHEFTKDMKWRWYGADGKVRLGLNGRAEEEKTPRSVRPQADTKHLPITIKFDEVAPTEVKTRTVVFLMGVPLSKDPNQPDGVPYNGVAGIPSGILVVYHDTWRLEDGEWKKDRVNMYSATSSGGIRSTESCPIPPGTAPGCAPIKAGADK